MGIKFIDLTNVLPYGPACAFFETVGNTFVSNVGDPAQVFTDPQEVQELGPVYEQLVPDDFWDAVSAEWVLVNGRWEPVNP